MIITGYVAYNKPKRLGGPTHRYSMWMAQIDSDYEPFDFML